MDEKRGYFQVLRRDYGTWFMVQMATQYFGNNGFILTCISLGQLPYYKARGVTGIRYQLLRTASGIPWGFKGLVGVVSDTWPLGGYHKRYWVFLGACLGSVGLTCLGLFPDMPIELSAFCFFSAQCAVVIGDLLCQGKYAELMAEGRDGSIVSYAFYCREGGRLLGALLVGPLADSIQPRFILLSALPLGLWAMVPPLCGGIPEVRNESCACKTEWVKKHPGPISLAVIQSLCALSMAFVLVLSDNRIFHAVASVSVSVLLTTLAYVVLPRLIANVTLYLFCGTTLYLGLDALDYWYTASKACIPDGPGFTITYYYTFANVIQALCGFLAVALFENYVKFWRVRPAFWITTLVRIWASCTDLAIVLRWNIRLGIPDTWAFIVGNAAIDQLAEMLDFMPVIFLVGKMCPKNLESTIFAILIGISNFGKTLASILGAGLLTALDVKLLDPPGGPVECNVDGLPTALFVGHVALPALTILLTFVLLPDQLLDSTFDVDALVEHGGVELTGTESHGSEAAREPPIKGLRKGQSSQILLRDATFTGTESLIRRASNTLGQVVPLSREF